MIRIGLDIGSTTIKAVVVDENNKILYTKYERHLAQIKEKMYDLISEIHGEFPLEEEVGLSISGSAGMGIANDTGVQFVQEVFATRIAVKSMIPEADVVIELGGEDAKILFLSGLSEVRMNGSCAGGTGAFIDQMATLLNINPMELNDLAIHSEKIYSIASRCGVFAKSDIQPLLNQGANRNDICASILYAVVNQTIAGLAQGRDIEGNIVYLGGPLNFFSHLRTAFDNTLNLKGILPENSLYFVALGTAMAQTDIPVKMKDVIAKLASYESGNQYVSCKPLFANQADFDEFCTRHKAHEEPNLVPLKGKSYIGIDAGSTTLKAVLINEDGDLVDYKYMENKGTPVVLVKDFLEMIYEKYKDLEIAGFATTGYGEEMIKQAFHADMGLVETMAHFTAAKKFDPKVDFIIDIGGQDIKCFKIRNGAIDNIFLNEACSSGCGSFLQTFAQALGEDIEYFSNLGLFAEHPVDLGSRCTVFMNSSVKQAQKDGAGIENISAGLSISVVKNALYKVIRASSGKDLGDNIVVQGGTFLNNAVLRAFEQEIGKSVTRPNISGLMGAYGAALFVKENFKEGKSAIITKEELLNFEHKASSTTCKICQNHCKLTINTFGNQQRYVAGNLCSRPVKQKAKEVEDSNLFEYKAKLLSSYSSFVGKREQIGIPLGLNLFELLPFWHTFFGKLDFGVEVSTASTRDLYLKGQHTIPSDTVCYPAKIMHGHIEDLLDKNVDAIFYPCMSYNIDEGLGDNNYNCPVVAYYPEVIGSNMNLRGKKLMNDYLGLHRPKDFVIKMQAILEREFGNVSIAQVQEATDAAFAEYQSFMERIRNRAKAYMEKAINEKLPIIVLAGRPYHLDQEINHGIHRFISDFGAVVLTEEAISHLVDPVKVSVLNQWTYHSRLYAAAKFVGESEYENINFVQLVSFGCGVDSITTDEVRAILERKSKIYTQIKIDEITNLGAVKIRLRSLFAVMPQ